jgi:hypothetical protein
VYIPVCYKFGSTQTILYHTGKSAIKHVNKLNYFDKIHEYVEQQWICVYNKQRKVSIQ